MTFDFFYNLILMQTNTFLAQLRFLRLEFIQYYYETKLKNYSFKKVN